MVVEKLGIIIPTRDRPEQLRRLLENIATQEVKPVQIIIVDGSHSPEQKVLEQVSGLTKIDYIRKVPASLTAQRNIGIEMLHSEVTLACFFDDDIVLKQDCLNNMLRFWSGTSEDTAGAGFNLINEIYKKPTLFEKIFLVNADTPSRILRSGFQSKLCFQNKTTSAEWLPGCSMVWRKKIFKVFRFDEWYSGYARYEDVDFSYRVGRKYKMYIVADAQVQHLNKLESINFSSALGKMEVVNRLYFVKKNQLCTPLCYWALLGLFLNNVVKALRGVDIRYLYRSRGNFLGFMHIIGFRK